MSTKHWAYCSWDKSKHNGLTGTYKSNIKKRRVKNLNAINRNYRNGKKTKKHPYTSGIKFYGKFSASIDRYNDLRNKKYRYFWRNCVQATADSLSYGTFKAKKGKTNKKIANKIKNKFTKLRNEVTPSSANRQLNNFLKKKKYKNYYRKM